MLFSQTEIDLGAVKHGTVAEARVIVTNNTSNYISVSIPYSSCSCTTGSIRENPIPPNAETIFFINLDTNKSGIGVNMMKSITMNWNENNITFSQTFMIKADVIVY
jgi:hypothetical protein